MHPHLFQTAPDQIGETSAELDQPCRACEGKRACLTEHYQHSYPDKEHGGGGTRESHEEECRCTHEKEATHSTSMLCGSFLWAIHSSAIHSVGDRWMFVLRRCCLNFKGERFAWLGCRRVHVPGLAHQMLVHLRGFVGTCPMCTEQCQWSFQSSCADGCGACPT